VPTLASAKLRSISRAPTLLLRISGGLLVTLTEVLSRAGKMRGLFRSLKTPKYL
jgi:hypothetical protein